MSALVKGKKKKISFNPLAIRRQPSDDNGEYNVTIEPIKPSNFPPTIEQMKANLKAEDINYVFVYVLNFWSSGDHEYRAWLVSANMKKYADKRQNLANGKNKKLKIAGREIYRATHRDLLVQCQKLLTQLAAGRVVTLKSKAGQMNVNPVASSETVDINDVKTLIDHLENWLLDFPEPEKKDNVCDSVRGMCVIGYMPQFRTFTLK